MSSFKRLVLCTIPLLLFVLAFQSNLDVVRISGALPSGTNTLGKVQIDQSVPNVSNNVTVQQNVTGSTLNSSTAQLGVGATFTGACESTLSANALQINVVSDQNMAVEVDQSPVANCATIATAFTYTVTTPTSTSPYSNYTTEATNSFYRIKVTNNGGATTTTFRVDTAVCPICNSGFASGGLVLANAGVPIQASGDANGRLNVNIPTVDPCQSPSVAKTSIFKNITTATTTAVITSSASTVISICHYDVVMTGTVTADTILLEDGTGAACATTQVPKTPTYSSGVLSGGATVLSVGYGGTVFSTAAGGEICAVSTVATTPTISLMITFVQQ